MAVVIRAGSRPTERAAKHRRVDVRALDWETAFFGARMGALVIASAPDEGTLLEQANLLAEELRNALREAELDGYRHLSLKVDAHDLPAIWAAERAGLRLMDVAVDLTNRFGSPLTVPQRPVRAATSDDIPALRDMTRGAFGLTRFAVDPFFTADQVDEFYATWATNLFSGLADHVHAMDIDGQLAGFVSAKVLPNGEGRIPLVATATQFQRRGVARDLVAASLEWFARTGCSVVHVKTQAANSAAVALYERAGFTLSTTELTFTTTLN